MSKWISVKDRLPAKDGFYVVFGGGHRTLEVANFSVHGFYTDDIEHDWETEYVMIITHWMELPDAPE